MTTNNQNDLPGVEGPGVAPIKIDEIDQLAEEYVKIRDKRCTISPKEIAAKQELIDAVKRHREQLGADEEGTIRYAYGEEIIEVSHGKDKLKIINADAA